jgi:filamentous hemagglutinin
MTGSKIKRLTSDMKANGFDPAHPIEVATVEGRQIIVDGHHRAAAAVRAGIPQVPVTVTPVSPAQAAQLAREAAEAAAQRSLYGR